MNLRAILIFFCIVTASAAQAEEKFDILEFRVLGNSVLPAVDVERAVYPFLGPQHSISDVEQARDALVSAYRTRGYGAVYVDIPEQDVEGGLVRLQVTEGRLDRVRISGTRYFSNGAIRASLPALAQNQPVDTAKLQAQLTEVNSQTRDRTVVPVLKAGREPGKIDLELKVSDHLPLHASFDVNNRYSPNTSQTRVGFNFSYDNLFQRFHSFSLQYQTAPEEPSETRVIAATYVLPVDTGGQLALYAVDTNSDVAAVGTLSVLGAGRIYGARYIMRVPELSPGWTGSLSVGADYKDFNDLIRLPDAIDATPIKYLTWSALYSASLTTDTTSTSFSITPTFGIGDLVNDGDQFAFKRFDAKPSFFYLRGSFQHERPLFLGTRIFARVNAQWTGSPLISNEQLSLGGADTVRGYLEAEALGDYGYSGSLEWRSPSLVPMLGQRWTQAYFFAFFDGGFVRVVEPLPSQVSRFDLSSWGAGLRLGGLEGFSAALDWARPRRTTTYTDAGDSRIHFDVSYAF